MVPNREEIQQVFASLDEVPLLVCSLLYGAGPGAPAHGS
jgi:hypothetical protein